MILPEVRIDHRIGDVAVGIRSREGDAQGDAGQRGAMRPGPRVPAQSFGLHDAEQGGPGCNTQVACFFLTDGQTCHSVGGEVCTMRPFLVAAQGIVDSLWTILLIPLEIILWWCFCKGQSIRGVYSCFFERDARNLVRCAGRTKSIRHVPARMMYVWTSCQWPRRASSRSNLGW